MLYLAIFVVICVLQTSAQAADRIRIGMPNDAGQFTLPLAQKRGYLRDEGFDAEIDYDHGAGGECGAGKRRHRLLHGLWLGHTRHGSGSAADQDRGSAIGP